MVGRIRWMRRSGCPLWLKVQSICRNSSTLFPSIQLPKCPRHLPLVRMALQCGSSKAPSASSRIWPRRPTRPQILRMRSRRRDFGCWPLLPVLRRPCAWRALSHLAILRERIPEVSSPNCGRWACAPSWSPAMLQQRQLSLPTPWVWTEQFARSARISTGSMRRALRYLPAFFRKTSTAWFRSFKRVATQSGCVVMARTTLRRSARRKWGLRSRRRPMLLSPPRASC